MQGTYAGDVTTWKSALFWHESFNVFMAQYKVSLYFCKYSTSQFYQSYTIDIDEELIQLTKSLFTAILKVKNNIGK